MAYKPKTIKLTVADAVSNAFSEFTSLGEEMRETADNMEGANMGHMPKCEAAVAAADELENHADEPEVPDCLASIDVEAVEMVNKDKRKATSRSTRLDNAKNLIQAVTSTLGDMDIPAFEKLREDLLKTKKEGAADDEVPTAEELEEKADELAQELSEHADFDVDFPGMYG